ncbi:ABC transporter permease [Plantactinospora sp. CA-290183]|uniref:ABC transporter permease n=1 Tax=Plantactinospora sp. CA-290183 TaxID=3240006 RepID=UPI003D8EDA86
MSRLHTVIRVQLVGWQATLGWPLLLLALIFALNYALFAAIGGDIEGGPKTGAVISIYIMMFIQSINWITQLFPFTLAMSVLRRTFYAAITVLVLVQAVVFGVMLFLANLVERATDGWGLSMRFFGFGFIDQDNPLLQVAVYAAPFVLLNFLGIFIALYYKRWGLNGMYGLTAAGVVVLGGGAVLLSWQRGWGTIWNWLADQPTALVFAGWPAVIALVLAGAGFLTIRRVTP